MTSTEKLTDHRKGLAIAGIGGLLLACDIPLIRLAETDPWTTLMVRGPIMFVTLFIAYYILNRKGLTKAKFIDGNDTLILGIMHAIATVGFVLAIYHTTTANLVFITAFSSLIAIVFSTLILKERHPWLTWMTILVALSGIAIITIDDFVTTDGRNSFGNLMALMCACMLAAEVIFIRKSGKNLVFAPALAGLIAAAFAAPLALGYGITLEKPSYLIINSIFVSPIAMAFMSLAPRYIPAPEAAMFYLLETVFAPLFVWVIFLEQPTPNTLLGGAIIITQFLKRIRESSRQNPCRHGNNCNRCERSKASEQFTCDSYGISIAITNCCKRR